LNEMKQKQNYKSDFFLNLKNNITKLSIYKY